RKGSLSRSSSAFISTTESGFLSSCTRLPAMRPSSAKRSGSSSGRAKDWAMASTAQHGARVAVFGFPVLLQIAQAAADQGELGWRQMIDEDLAVEMVEFVLGDHAQEIAGLDVEALALLGAGQVLPDELEAVRAG